MDQSRWDRALQDSVSKVIRAEMETAAAGERAELLSEKLREKEKEYENWNKRVISCSASSQRQVEVMAFNAMLFQSCSVGKIA